MLILTKDIKNNAIQITISETLQTETYTQAQYMTTFFPL